MPVKPRILAIGSSNIDFIANVECVPRSGETLISNGSYSFVPGGKGANSAVAASRLGADVVFCTRVGNDTYGKFLANTYSSEKIDTRYVGFDKEKTTGLAAIYVEETGANRITVFPGANHNISKDDVEESFTSYPDALLMQFEIQKDIIVSSVKMANDNNIPVFIDAGPVIQDFDMSELGRIEIFSPNETEAFAYTGINPVDNESFIRISMNLYSKLNVKYIVLKLGSRGCYIYDGHRGEAIPSYYVNAVDTTAAGDAFTAALTFEYLRSGSIKSACKYANAVGAITVTKHGAMPSLPTESQVIEFLSQHES